MVVAVSKSGGWDRHDVTGARGIPSMPSNAFFLVISREQVNAGDTSSALSILGSCLASPARALSLFQKVDISFSGYEDISRELYEIPEVRDYVRALDDEFPFWLFFLTKFGLGLQCIMLCFMPPFLTDAGRQRAFPKSLGSLLMSRWFPAMNQICEWVGFSEDQIEQLSDEVGEYFSNGPTQVTK